jgi:hypothetical protein
MKRRVSWRQAKTQIGAVAPKENKFIRSIFKLKYGLFVSFIWYLSFNMMKIFHTSCDFLEEKISSSINKKQVVSQLEDGCLILGIKVSERHFGTRRELL